VNVDSFRHSARRPRRSNRLAAAAVALFLSTSLLAACGGGNSDAGSGGGVVLRGADGDPSNGPVSAPFGSMQIQEGLDEKGGFTLEWSPASSAATALQLLSAGKLDLAQTSTPLALATAKTDPDLRIIGFLNGPIYNVLAPEGGDITSATDLEGKTVGVVALGSASQLMVQGSMTREGLDGQTAATFVASGVGAPMAEALNSGQIDAIAGWEGMWQSISALTDTPLQRVDTYMSELPGQVAVVSTKQVLEEHPAEVQAWLDNFYKMCALGAVDPERAVQDHWEQNPKLVPPAAEREETLADLASYFQDFYSFCSEPGAETGTVGTLSESELQNLYDFYIENGVLPGEVDWKSVVDTSLTEKALGGVDVAAWAEEYSAS